MTPFVAYSLWLLFGGVSASLVGIIGARWIIGRSGGPKHSAAWFVPVAAIILILVITCATRAVRYGTPVLETFSWSQVLNKTCTWGVKGSAPVVPPTVPRTPPPKQHTIRSSMHLIADGCGISGAWFSVKGKQLILTIGYGIVSSHRRAYLYTLHCGVVDVTSAYRGYRPGRVTYRTFVDGGSNESGGIQIKWRRAYELGEEVEYKYMCTCTATPVTEVGRVRTNYLNVRPE